ncbi:MAG: peroxiredoxin [Candidatus Thiodiazotropha sp. (ex Lucina pensylvanica)]|nr:peroxiredoxin [Candidatus Thiodiazotropha sp. (ex Lucina pensylvanica)]MCG7864645.1 peroxiredoxin [Candidatus Thiodiazotropha endolucinida]
MFTRYSQLPFAVGVFSLSQAICQARVDQPAPCFSLPDQNGKLHGLDDYRGRWLVLYFYPKDDTPGCSREACSFRDELARLNQMGVDLLGISTDGVASHLRFSDKFNIAFPLLSDNTGEVAASYGALFKLGPVKLAKRHTVIIDPTGCIAKIFRKVDPSIHSDEVTQALASLI